MFNRKFMALVMGGCMSAAVANAGDSHNGWVGGRLGLVTAAGNDYTSAAGDNGARFGFGLDAGGLLLDGQLGVGAYFDWSKKGSAVSNTLMLYGLQVNYNFVNMVPGLFAGLKFGLTADKLNVPAAPAFSYTSSPFHIGPQVGWDYAFGGGFSAGVVTDLIFVMSKTNTVNATTLTQASFRVWDLMATVKYWF